MTSSAMASSVVGTSIPSVRAVAGDGLEAGGRYDAVGLSVYCRLIRPGLPKVRWCESGPSTKRRREMTAAGKSQANRDLFDGQFPLIDQQVTRRLQPPLHDVGMRRRSRTL